LENLEFRILAIVNSNSRAKNPEFKILKRFWHSKILNSGFWPSKISNSGFWPFQNREFRILAFQNLEFRILALPKS